MRNNNETTYKNMETQTIEYKQQWYDKYLAYISGFANAQMQK